MQQQAATRRSEHTFSRPHTHSCRPSHRVRLQHNIGQFASRVIFRVAQQIHHLLPLLPVLHQSATWLTAYLLHALLVVQPYGVTRPISTASLFEIDARGMALGSFAAQNRYLKRVCRLPLDQAAYHDFSDSRLRLVEVFVPYAARSPPVSYGTDIPLIPRFCTTEISQHSCLSR